jgi:hypothetical protein
MKEHVLKLHWSRRINMVVLPPVQITCCEFNESGQTLDNILSTSAKNNLDQRK